MSENDKEKVSLKEKIRINMLERQDEARTVRKIMLIVVLVLFIAAAAILAGGYFYIKSALEPADADDTKIRKIEIPIGSSVSTITSILEEKGIVKNGKVFKYYIKFKNEAGFQAGEYELSPSMSLDEILAGIKSGKVVKEATVKIAVPEGKQLVEIAGIIAEKTGKDPKAVFKQLNDKKFVKKMQAKHPNLLTDEIHGKNIKYPLEGYLYPATYSFYDEKPDFETIISDMLAQSEKVLEEYRDGMAEKKLSVHELLTLASLIEEEATVKVDRDMISSVFHNRLKEDMPLQTDPTVLYSKGSHQERVFYKDLEVKSPYNTYIHKGLTPGPIANAGKSSIEAALNPADSKNLYFLATKSGKVLFSETLKEHNKKKAEHITK